MGCYGSVYAGKDEALVYKNVLPPFLLGCFNKCDLIRGTGSKAAKIARKYGLISLASWLDEYQDNRMLIFAQKASIIKARLKIYGYTDVLYEVEVKKALDEQREFLQGCLDNNNDTSYRNALKKDIAELDDFRKKGDINVDLISRIKSRDLLYGDKIIDTIPDDIIFYGCVMTLNDDDLVVLDYSDLDGGGYMEITEFENKDNNPVIIVEGKNDLRVLKTSLGILYPELVDNITFLDIEGYKVEGGAGAVVKMVKSFAGANFKNRILAVLDNDTGARSALLSIKKVSRQFPSNIRLTQYPNIKTCEKYPTIGPQGEAIMDVNGLAGSIEMYLGAEALMADGKLEKVIWTSYLSDVGEYQGVLIDKESVNERFGIALDKVLKEGYEYDFSDLKSVWKHIISELSNIPPYFAE